MSFTIKISGDAMRPIVCVYTCPEHGAFDAEVVREADGGAPEIIQCGAEIGIRAEGGMMHHCEHAATWTPSAVACRVRRIEVSRGKWESPERKTYLDTRKLGEGQSVEEFQAERKKVWNDQRHKRVKDLLR